VKDISPSGFWKAGRFVLSACVVVFAIWVNLISPEESADKASRDARNEFFIDLQRSHKEVYGRGISLTDPAIQQIYEFDAMEAGRGAVDVHFKKIKYPMAVFYLIALGLGVCRMWAAGCITALLVLPMLLTKEYSVFAFQLGAVLAGVAIYRLWGRRYFKWGKKEGL